MQSITPKQMTIFQFKDAVTELVFGKLASNDVNQTPYDYDEVLERLGDMLATQMVDVPITQYDIDDCFEPLVREGNSFEWSFNSDDGAPITLRFVPETDDETDETT